MPLSDKQLSKRPSVPDFVKSCPPICVGGQQTGSVTSLVKFKAPFDGYLISSEWSAQAKGGTHGTTTFNVKIAGTSALTGAISYAAASAGDVVAGVIDSTKTHFAAGDAITMDLVMTGGSSPTLTNITWLPVFRPELGEERI